MSTHYSDKQLRLAARLYYLDGLGQIEVAKLVKVSQAKISRLLALARERGIVRISVAEYEPRDDYLERRLRQGFGLHSVAVIKTVDHATVEDARRLIGHFGSPFVASLIPANSIAAIAAAIRGGLLKSVVIDEAGATALLTEIRPRSVLPRSGKKGRSK